MLRRAARLLLRAAGWLLTPLVLIGAAGLGATLGLYIAPRVSPDSGLILTLALALAFAIGGLIVWARLLRRSPELRHAFAVTEAGLPESQLVENLVHPDAGPGDGEP